MAGPDLQTPAPPILDLAAGALAGRVVGDDDLVGGRVERLGDESRQAAVEELWPVEGRHHHRDLDRHSGHPGFWSR